MKKLLLFCALLLAATIQGQNTCNTALPISAGIHTISEINGPQIPAPICTANGTGPTSASEWYSYTPIEDLNVTITTDLVQNNGRDTRFHVYTGSCGTLSCFAGDDDAGTDFTSYDSFEVTVGTTYFIAFDNRWSSGGFDFQLTESEIVEPVPPAVNFSVQDINIEGTAACIVDMNGDFLDDIVGVETSVVHILHQTPNTSGFTLSSIPTPQANFLPGWSIAAGDLDKNGRNDLLYGSGSGVTFMKQNGDGSGFVEVSGPQNVFSQRSNMVDINNDGNLDAFVCHDVAPNVYYLSDLGGNLTFHQGGLGDFPSGGNYGSIWVDYDNDNDPDLFIAKCRGGNSGANIDELHRNNGDGTFTNVSIEANMNEPSQSWSSAWGDFDNDGDMDAMIGASSFTTGGHKLRRNNGDGTFTDITVGSGWDTFAATNIEYVAHDFDNDGWIDIFGGNQTIMMNNGDMTFTPSVVAPSNGPTGDLNNDGFLDVQNNSQIFLNEGNDNNWIKIHLQGIQSNANGIGARVEIYGPWGKQIRDVRSGDGFRYMSSLNVHFGIGAATNIDQVIVRWPSGIVDVVENPEINLPLLVPEGSAPLSSQDFDVSGIGIYPNPANDILNISSKSGNNLHTSEIYDLSGRKILSEKMNGTTVNIRTLSTGSYILMLTDKNGKKYSGRFLKK